MSMAASEAFALPAGYAGAARPRSALHRLTLGIVWLTVVLGCIVYPEPAPVDVLTLGLVVLLPILGLASFAPALLALFGALLIAGAAALVATAHAIEINLAATHTGISIYLYVATIVFAAFVAKKPAAHARLLLDAHLCAATLAALIGIAGYFDLAPGAQDLLTRYGRATGMFKDPNVFGPFLVPAILYALSRLVAGGASRMRTLTTIGVLPVLAVAMLLSFSRGAWLCLAIGLAAYVLLQFLAAPSNRIRARLMGLAVGSALALSALVGATLQIDEVADLFAERASLTQDYDEGPEGRFGGQQKAARLALENPFGIGAQQFAPHFHHEEPHNTYLAMFLNAGWLGGLLFLAIVATTVVHGLRHALRRSACQPMFLAAYAAFVGHAAEAAVIDIDHWRHFYLLLAIVWGLMASAHKAQRPAA